MHRIATGCRRLTIEQSNPTGSQALNSSPGKDHRGIVCTTAEAAAQGEDGNAAQHDPSSTENVGQLAKKGLNRRAASSHAMLAATNKGSDFVSSTAAHLQMKKAFVIQM